MEFMTALVEHSFGFLVRDFGYSRRVPAASGSAAYFKEPLLVQFWWGKGEIDILFEVTFDFTRDHEVFRPYISRMFTLRELALHDDGRPWLRCVNCRDRRRNQEACWRVWSSRAGTWS